MTSGSIISGMPYFSQSARSRAMFSTHCRKIPGFVRNHEEVRNHAGRVELNGRQDGGARVLQHRPNLPMPDAIVGVAKIGSQHQRRPCLVASGLQEIGLAIVELNGVGASFHENPDHSPDVLEPIQESRLVGDAVVDRNVQTPSIAKQAMHARLAGNAHSWFVLTLRRTRQGVSSTGRVSPQGWPRCRTGPCRGPRSTS